MVNINIQVQKKDLWLLLAIVVFLVGVGYVIAGAGQGPSLNPGHDLDTIQGYNVGDADLGDTIADIYAKLGSVSGCSLGEWNSKNNNQVYVATEDGFVIASDTTSNDMKVKVFMGDAADSLSRVGPDS
mgnify:CR=1 FL=1